MSFLTLLSFSSCFSIKKKFPHKINPQHVTHNFLSFDPLNSRVSIADEMYESTSCYATPMTTPVKSRGRMQSSSPSSSASMILSDTVLALLENASVHSHSSAGYMSTACTPLDSANTRALLSSRGDGVVGDDDANATHSPLPSTSKSPVGERNIGGSRCDQCGNVAAQAGDGTRARFIDTCASTPAATTISTSSMRNRTAAIATTIATSPHEHPKTVRSVAVQVDVESLVSSNSDGVKDTSRKQNKSYLDLLFQFILVIMCLIMCGILSILTVADSRLNKRGSFMRYPH